MKKVLIYKSETDLSPTGGPNGYLYNFNKGYSRIKQEYDDIEIAFMPRYNKKAIRVKVICFLKKHFKKTAFRYYINSILKDKAKSVQIPDIDKYDIIHFHSTIDYYLCRKQLHDFRGKVVVTSHSPMPAHQELVDYLRMSKQSDVDALRKRLEVIDIFAFDNADYIIFPCEEAEECYYNAWDKYKEIKARNKDKYIYIPTGIEKVQTNEERSKTREKYGIPKSKFIICYAGRHNEVKGYDSLKRIGKYSISKDKDLFFVIAGEESPISGLKNTNWVELGWTNNVYNIINSADVFVLPNKQTYFDLIMLEALSIGIPVVATSTGGNKYFKSIKESGIFFYEYDNTDGFYKTIEKIKKMDLEEIRALNKKVFEKNFTADVFARKYIEVYKKIS